METDAHPRIEVSVDLHTAMIKNDEIKKVLKPKKMLHKFTEKKQKTVQITVSDNWIKNANKIVKIPGFPPCFVDDKRKCISDYPCFFT